MNLEDISPWHTELNDGAIPFLEIPDGTIISDSNKIMEYVVQNAGKEGLNLLPLNSKEDVKMTE